MLQFNKNQSTNTNAVYLDSIPVSLGDNVEIVLSQSYDRSTDTFIANVISSPTEYNNWLVFRNDGVDVPVPSGQYDAEVYTIAIGNPIKWGEATMSFADANFIWGLGDGVTKVDLAYSDRAFVQGTNESTITQYVSPDENGTYTTYNG